MPWFDLESSGGVAAYDQPFGAFVCDPFRKQLLHFAGIRRSEGDWFRGIRDQCLASGTPFHFKQWGEYGEDGRRTGTKNNGRVLDGKIWDEVCTSAVA